MASRDGACNFAFVQTELWPLLADKAGVGELRERFERRGGRESTERKRKDDFGFEPTAKIYQESCSNNKIDLAEVDFTTRHGQQLGELLIHLKDRGGLKYGEIAKLPEFAALKMKGETGSGLAMQHFN